MKQAGRWGRDSSRASNSPRRRSPSPDLGKRSTRSTCARCKRRCGSSPRAETWSSLGALRARFSGGARTSCASLCTRRAIGASNGSWPNWGSNKEPPRARSIASIGRVARICEIGTTSEIGSSAIVDLAIDTSTFGTQGSAKLVIDAVACSLTRAFSRRCVFAIFACSGSVCWFPTSGVGCSLPRKDTSSHRSPDRRTVPRLTSAFSAPRGQFRYCCFRPLPASWPIRFHAAACSLRPTR